MCWSLAALLPCCLPLPVRQKLPVCHKLSDGSFEPLTVLEAVVKQTGIYAPSR